MRGSDVIVFAGLAFSMHCEGPAPNTRDLATPMPTLSASRTSVRPAPRSYEFGGRKGPLASVSADEQRFRLVLRANGWGDFSRRLEILREQQITDVESIEIDLPVVACKFGVPGGDRRLHHCYYFEKSTNEKPAEIRFVLRDKRVITWSDAAPNKRFFVSEGLTLVSTEEVNDSGESTKARYFSFHLMVSVMDEPSRPAIVLDLPLYFTYGPLP